MPDTHDLLYMRHALALAERGRGWTSPNPMVGAVVVRDGVIVGEGYHPKVGEPHAEVFALREAGERARGGTLYVTLEPCCVHGRTPPCTDAVLASGVARVVTAMADPDPRMAGQGLSILEAAGIKLRTGVLENEAQRLNEAYVHHRRTGRPFVVLKLAQSLDGRIATATRRARWITGVQARQQAHRLRSEADAVLVGVGTVLADDPRLTVRHVEGRQPQRIVLDGRARTPRSARLLTDGPPPLICVTDRAPQDRIEALRRAGAEVLTLPAAPDDTIDLAALLQRLGERQTVTLLVEGGSRVATAFLRAQAAQKLVLFIAPKLFGGGIPGIGELGIKKVDHAITLRDLAIERAGDDLVVIGYPVYA